MNYRLTLALGAALHLGAQSLHASDPLLASYPLDGDATDAQGVYDATASAEGVTWSASDVLVGEEGALTAPDSLTDNLFLTDGSLQLNFSFTVESAKEDGVKQLVALQKNNSVAARGGGLMLNYVEDATDSNQVRLFLSYADGVSIDYYSHKQVATCDVGQRYDLKLVFDFDADIWTVKVGDEYATGPINNNSDYSYDIAAWKELMRNTSLRFGAFGFKGEADPLEESEVRFDNILVYSPAQSTSAIVNSALDALTAHVTGVTPLLEAQLATHLETLQESLALASFTEMKPFVEAFMQAYEDNNTPLFASDALVDSASFDSVTQAFMFVQQWGHSELFAPEFIDQVGGYVFEAHESFPGVVSATAPRVASATVTVDGDYAIDPGALMIWADTVLRPLGHYVPAGEIVTISVDPAYTGLGLKVVVGAHSRDLDEDVKPTINRFRDISAEYDLDQASITVANPFGGGLYIRVPDGTSVGDIDVTVQGAVKSAYFSARAGKETDVAAWLAEVAASEVPWVDFESDKFMCTIPLNLAQAATDPVAVMAKWDDIMDQFRIMNGRPLNNRIRAEYFLLDRMLVTPAWGAGYPMVVPDSSAQGVGSNWNPMNVLTVEPNRTLFHELGHNCAIPGPVHNPVSRVLADMSVKELGTWAEGENLVNIPAFIIGNKVYGESLDNAFSSATFQTLTIDEAAFDWMITENFRNNRQIGLDTSGVYDIDNNNETDELRYQARGIGRYGDIVKIFGWEGLELAQAEFYPIRDEDITPSSDQGRRHRIDRDALIRRYSQALGVNMAPLLHFWGVKPSAELKAELATMPKSRQIKEMLDHYAALAPTTRAEFDTILAQLAPNVGDYTIERHDYYQGYVTDADAQAIGTQIQFVIDEYELNETGVPSGLTLRQRPDGRVIFEWQDNAAGETGFIIRAKVAGEVVYTQLGSSAADSTRFVSAAIADAAYTFSVVAVLADGTESMPVEVTVDDLPAEELGTIGLELNVFEEVSNSFTVTNLISTDNSHNSGKRHKATSLKATAAEILAHIQTVSGDSSIGYDDVSLNSVVLQLPAEFISSPQVVQVLNENTMTFAAFAGGSNTTGNPVNFAANDQQANLTNSYSFGEGNDFYFMLYNLATNSEESMSVASLLIDFTISGGYRHWYETNGLELGVNAAQGDDPDGDQLSNELEFAFGRNPNLATEGSAVDVSKGAGASQMDIKFQRGQATLTYQVVETSDLSDWSGATVIWDSSVDVGSLVAVGMEQSVSADTSSAPRMFYRVKVSE